MWAALLTAFIALVFLYIVLGKRPFGVQLTTLIVYTCVVFFFIFFKTRLGDGNGLRNEAVRRCIPRLLAIHVSFLALVFTIQTSALALEPRLSSWWLEENAKRMTPFQQALFIVCATAGLIQVSLSRRILRSSREATSAD